MQTLPINMLATIPDDARLVVERWWSSLTEADRQNARDLWDERRETCFFLPQLNNAGIADTWEEVPDVEGGRFIPHDDSWRMHEWIEDWHVYLSGHEEIILLPQVVVVIRTFHICHRELAAQAVLSAGRLPAEFSCPLASAACPMRHLQSVAPKKAIHIGPAESGGWWVVGPWR